MVAEAMKTQADGKGRVFVLGSLNMDIVATAPWHPQVGETVLGGSLNYYPGGKGLNQAVAAVRDEAEVVMLGAVGSDGFGRELLDFAASEGIVTDFVRISREVPSGVALIVVAEEGEAEGDNTIVVASGANGTLAPEMFEDIRFQPSDVLLAQFETPTSTTASLFTRAKEAAAVTILNPAPAAPLTAELASLTDYLVVNDTELSQITESLDKQAEDQQATHLLNFGIQALIHTKGADGVSVKTKSSDLDIPAHKVPVVDTTAAGDCFCGVLAASLLRGATIAEAATRSNAAAALTVQTPGAAPSIPFSKMTNRFCSPRC